jgi:uncharacterized cupin superfamily protein
VLAHLDEVEGHRREAGHLGARWSDLGAAAGSVAVGLRRIEVDPGRWSTPAHVHGREEEIFWVLGGSGLSWQAGETWEISPGDCLVHNDRRPHTLRAGEGGLDVLAFGLRARDEAAYLPRAGVLWLGMHWVDAADPARTPFERESAAGPPALPAAPSPRGEGIVNVVDVGSMARGGVETSEWRDLGAAAGSKRSGLKHVRVLPGEEHCPPHCHSAEEELFVILDGAGTLRLTPSPRSRDDGAVDESLEVRAGHVVSRPAGTRIAHAFEAGRDGLTLLAYGTRDPNDIAYYPRSNKLSFRGVGVIARLEHLEYWDGERGP